MTGGTHSQGAFAKLLFEPGAAIGGAHTFDSDSKALEFLSETMSRQGRTIGGRGIRGTLDAASERTREGASFYRGEISMYLSPQAVHDFCASDVLNLFGCTESPTDTFQFDTNPGYFGILLDTDYDTWEFVDCMVDYWQIRSRAPMFGESGEPDMVYLTLGIIGSNETPGTAWPSQEPSIGTAATDAPYVFHDSSTGTGITIGGTEREVEEFVLRVDYRVKAKYTNSLMPHSLRPRERIVRAMFRVPWNSGNDDLYDMMVGGVATSLLLTNGDYSTEFQLAKFQVPPRTPIVSGKDQISLVLSGQVRSSGSTEALIIVNDTT